MTVAQLIERLQKMPQDKEVLIERGEWGPCRTNWSSGVMPREATVNENDGDSMWWETMYPESPFDADLENPRHNVVLL